MSKKDIDKLKLFGYNADRIETETLLKGYKMKTRKQYMDEYTKAGLDKAKTRKLYREYTAQFVDGSIKKQVLRYFPEERLVASEDEHLNDIPLKQWDDCMMFMASGRLNNKLKEAGDCVSKATLVCIAKEAARQIIDEAHAKTAHHATTGQ